MVSNLCLLLRSRDVWWAEQDAWCVGKKLECLPEVSVNHAENWFLLETSR